MTKAEVQDLCRGNDDLEWAAAGFLFAEICDLVHHREQQPVHDSDDKFLVNYVIGKVKEFHWHVQQETLKACRAKVKDAKSALLEYSEQGVG